MPPPSAVRFRALRWAVSSALLVGVVAGPGGLAVPAGAGTSSPWRLERGAGVAGGELIAVTAVSPADVWAVGTTAPRGSFATLTEHFDGSRWTRVASPSQGDWNMLE